MSYCMSIRSKAIRFLYSLLGKYSPKTLAQLRFWRKFGRLINWDNPTDLNEKIQWLKFNSDTSKWTLLADKYKVRKYVESLGLGDILVKLYGKWDKVEDIDWDLLPNQFVMKVNNGSGDVLVCSNKKTLNIKASKVKFKKLLRHKFGYVAAEPHYWGIHPCIIAEELLDVTKQPIKTTSLIDYKIWCFNGEPECIWTCYNRTKNTVEVATYDLDWNYHPEWSVFTNHYIEAKVRIPKPVSLHLMLEIASKLSSGFKQVRVDLYEVGGKPYFGEMTFTSNMGLMDFYTQDYLNYLGSKVKIKP